MRYHVEHVNLEFDNPAADPEQLAALAEASKGTHVTLAEGARAFEELLDRPVETRKEVVTTQRIWDHPMWLLWIGLLLCAEWALRRFWGMV